MQWDCLNWRTNCYTLLNWQQTWLEWHQGVCVWCGQTSIPEKGTPGIWCAWVLVGLTVRSQSYMWTGVHSCVLRACDLLVQCKKHHTSYFGVGTPHKVPPAPFSEMLIRPHHTQTPWPCSPLIWNGIPTCLSIQTVSWHTSACISFCRFFVVKETNNFQGNFIFNLFERLVICF